MKRTPNLAKPLYRVVECPHDCVFTVVGETREAQRAINRHVVLRHADEPIPYLPATPPQAQARRSSR